MPEKKTRIMYIEFKGDGLTGPARIGRVTFNRTGATLYYGGKAFQSLKGGGFKANYFDVESGEHYWILWPSAGRRRRSLQNEHSYRNRRRCSRRVLDNNPEEAWPEGTEKS